MAHTKSRHKLERERREALDEIERLERPKRLKSEREAKLVVATWNVRIIRHSTVWFFPTIRAALIARRFYPGCLCPGCGQRAPSISDGLIATPPYDAGIGNLPDRFCPARGGY